MWHISWFSVASVKYRMIFYGQLAFCQILTSRHWCFITVLLFWFVHLLLPDFSPHPLRTAVIAGFCVSYIRLSARTQWTSAWLSRPASGVAMTTTYPPTKGSVVSYFSCLQQCILLQYPNPDLLGDQHWQNLYVPIQRLTVLNHLAILTSYTVLKLYKSVETHSKIFYWCGE